jgi:hypothetical protein
VPSSRTAGFSASFLAFKAPPPARPDRAGLRYRCAVFRKTGHGNARPMAPRLRGIAAISRRRWLLGTRRGRRAVLAVRRNRRPLIGNGRAQTVTICLRRAPLIPGKGARRRRAPGTGAPSDGQRAFPDWVSEDLRQVAAQLSQEDAHGPAAFVLWMTWVARLASWTHLGQTPQDSAGPEMRSP